jgi:hypothetical protein
MRPGTHEPAKAGPHDLAEALGAEASAKAAGPHDLAEASVEAAGPHDPFSASRD